MVGRSLYCRSAMVALVLAFSPIAVSSAYALDLDLTCGGIAKIPKVNGRTVSGAAGQGHAVGSASTASGSAPDRVLVSSVGNTVRVRLPRSMIPPVHSGGDDGWWRLHNVQVSDVAISGNFRVNILNKPAVWIDRTTGNIEIDGSFKFGFRGNCEVVDPQKRKF
jgi:hypothetical protein